MNIDLDDTGVGRDLDDVQTRILRWAVALYMDRSEELGCGVLHGREQVEIIFDGFDRRQKNIEAAVAWFDDQCSAHRNCVLLNVILRGTCLSALAILSVARRAC